MRYIIVSTAFIAAGLVSTASAANLSCNPAVQNWQNGSQTTCPYDSHGFSPEEVKQADRAPPPREVESEDTTVE